MKCEEVWSVVQVTERGGKAHVQMGRAPGVNPQGRFGPLIIVEIDEAPHIGDKICLTYAWGEDYAAPVTPIRYPGEIDTGAHWPVR